jgi:hypothetical protein
MTEVKAQVRELEKGRWGRHAVLTIIWLWGFKSMSDSAIHGVEMGGTTTKQE